MLFISYGSLETHCMWALFNVFVKARISGCIRKMENAGSAHAVGAGQELSELS